MPAIAIFKSKRRLGNLKQEKIVLERSARLNLDHGKGDKGDGGDR